MNLILNTPLQNNPTTYQQVGQVEDVVGMVITATGLRARIGDLCKIEDAEFLEQPLMTEVVGFKEGKLQLMPYGGLTQLSVGASVTNLKHSLQAPVGERLLGRVLNGLGEPIDGFGPLNTTQWQSTVASSPPVLSRRRIEEILPLGVRALDGLNTVGKGQRLGVFAGSGVGKSTLKGMIARNTQADLNVIALIGERSREVREFIEESLGEEGLKKSVVIVATAEEPAIMKIKAAEIALTIAESFRDQGQDVLFMMDSVTRIAMALREVGLSTGEPPTSRGYTPSVFAYLPKIVERCGMGETGSITGLFTVLVEGDDLNEPITDTMRGVLDGHIVLSRDLAYLNHFPAIDILASISRLMSGIASPEHKKAASLLRDLMATYKKSEDLITIGAYAQGTNPKLDLAIAMKEPIDRFLKQSTEGSVSFEEMLEALLQLTRQVPAGWV